MISGNRGIPTLAWTQLYWPIHVAWRRELPGGYVVSEPEHCLWSQGAQSPAIGHCHATAKPKLNSESVNVQKICWLFFGKLHRYLAVLLESFTDFYEICQRWGSI